MIETCGGKVAPVDLVQVGGDLRVVRRDRRERLGARRWRSSAETLPARGCSPPRSAYEAGLLTAATAGMVARRGREERGPAHVDHLERLGERDASLADLRRERRDVHDHDVQQARCRARKLGELVGPVAPGQDRRATDGRVIGPHDEPDSGGRFVRAVTGCSLDPVGEEMVPGPVGRVELDVQAREVACERADPIAIRNRQEGLAPGSISLRQRAGHRPPWA